MYCLAFQIHQRSWRLPNEKVVGFCARVARVNHPSVVVVVSGCMTETAECLYGFTLPPSYFRRGPRGCCYCGRWGPPHQKKTDHVTEEYPHGLDADKRPCLTLQDRVLCCVSKAPDAATESHALRAELPSRRSPFRIRYAAFM